MGTDLPQKTSRRKGRLLLAAGVLIGFALTLGAKAGIDYTSTDTFCDKACHSHSHATQSWIKSTHYTTKSGVTTHCVQCHLPPEGIDFLVEKARLGAQDAYGKWFKNAAKIDWLSKRSFDHAKAFTYDEACVKCHSILFSSKLSKKGVDGHLHYQRAGDRLRCISCHMSVGHWTDQKASEMVEGAEALDAYDPAAFPPVAGGFKNYSETIPGTDVKFEMVAIPGGEFTMGSPATESLRRADEGPPHRVRLQQFWMGKTEVRWREWDVFYAQRGTPGKEKEDANYGADAATGPTPPYGSPDQGWGKGAQPAITMTHHSAVVYCEWLSAVTGKKYRLPTEAEWEYACRAGTNTPYFFPGDPATFSADSWWRRLVGARLEPIGQFAEFRGNSNGRSHPPSTVKPNPWGLLNMIGNVAEFCFDYYDPQGYSQYPEGVVDNPRGPESGKEHVVRGGSYRSDASELRSAARDQTKTDDWLMTDPQSPKSIWWYSDCTSVGFRVVREYEPDSKPAPVSIAGSKVK